MDSLTSHTLVLNATNVGGGGAGLPLVAEGDLSQRVNTLACEILKFAHELRLVCELNERSNPTFGNKYFFPTLIGTSFKGKNIYYRFQIAYDNLKSDVETIADKEPKIQELFNRMISCGRRSIYNANTTEGLKLIRQDVVKIIGAENVMDGDEFNKDGVIFLKDKNLCINPGVNVLSSEELEEIQSMRALLLDPNEGFFNFEGNHAFFISNFKSNIEKLLTCGDGRKLINEILRHENFLKVFPLREFKVVSYDCNGVNLDENKIFVCVNNCTHLLGIIEGKYVQFINYPIFPTLYHEFIHCLQELKGCLEDYLATPAKDPKYTNKAEEEAIAAENEFLQKYTLFYPRIYHIRPQLYLDVEAFQAMLETAKEFLYYDGLIALVDANIDKLTDDQIFSFLEVIISSDGLSEESVAKMYSPKIVNQLFKNEKNICTFITYGLKNGLDENIQFILESAKGYFWESLDPKLRVNILMSTLIENNSLVDFLEENQFFRDLKNDFLKVLESSIKNPEEKWKKEDFFKLHFDFGVTDEEISLFIDTIEFQELIDESIANQNCDKLISYTKDAKETIWGRLNRSLRENILITINKYCPLNADKKEIMLSLMKKFGVSEEETAAVQESLATEAKSLPPL